MHRTALIGALCLALFSSLASADVRMPALFSDHMVIQRDTDAPIWGWADPGEELKITCSWSDACVETKAGADGRWMTKIATPRAGGPHQITVQGKNRIPIRNVFSGEVFPTSVRGAGDAINGSSTWPNRGRSGVAARPQFTPGCQRPRGGTPLRPAPRKPLGGAHHNDRRMHPREARKLPSLARAAHAPQQ